MADAQLGARRWQVEYAGSQPNQGIVIRRSGDGGKTWSTSDVPLPAKLGHLAKAEISFIDARQGWLLVGGTPATAQEPWALLQTSDGGRTWTVEQAAAPQGSGAFLGAAYAPVTMRFRSALQGFIAAADPWTAPPSIAVFRTLDGGRRWTAASVPAPHPMGGIRAVHLAFADADNGWMLVTGYPATAQEVWALLRTTDGGRTWSAEARTDFASGANVFLDGATGPTAMSFRSPSQGFIVTVDDWAPGGWYVDVYRTLDGGRRWQRQRVSLPPSAYNQVSAIGAPAFSTTLDGSFAVRLTSGVVRFATSDGGATWTEVR